MTDTLHDRALLALLTEWHRQLSEALDTAKAMLPDPEPQRVRWWKHPLPFRFFPPTENDPADQWEWGEEHRTPPALLDMEAVIERIGRQIGELSSV